ncbi:hypothetical protein GGR55DRAFT_634726 [Xylaria sp. FL0064]|nr:hypothetical protein GGR55DRAFT_634726 [Xylaria sp. FL0064]
MDGFMKESQRFNPLSVLSFHCVMVSTYDMKDGTHLPRGAHIAMPVQAIQHDLVITERPNVFHGVRYYKLLALVLDTSLKTV